MSPEASPPITICVTSGGKTPVSFNAADIGAPERTRSTGTRNGIAHGRIAKRMLRRIHGSESGRACAD